MELKDNDQLQFDFLPLAVSIETLGGIATPLVLRGTPLPANQTFSTASDNQKSVEVKVLLGERLLANKNITIGSCLLGDIPPAPKGQPQICVTFEVDRFCNVKVEALEVKSGKKIEATLNKTGVGLTRDMIQQLLREAEEHREEDKARSVIASAELQVRRAQEQNLSITTFFDPPLTTYFDPPGD
jgi:molecular chaperone DnaK